MLVYVGRDEPGALAAFERSLHLRREAGDCEEAEQRYRQSLRLALPLGDVIEASLEIQGVAMAAAGLGDARRAVRLGAAVEALWESLGFAISVRFWDELLRRYLGPAASELGEDAELVRAQGRSLSYEESVDEALAG